VTSYRPAPGRGRPFSRSQWAVSVALGLTVIGFVGAGQWNAALERQQFTTSAQQALAVEVGRLEEQRESLRGEIAQAEAEVRDLQGTAEGSESALRQLNERLAVARAGVGLTALRGPGAVIEIADSKRVIPPGESPANYIVLVDDLRDIVTALWASGADGIAINGQRLVASSSIYGVGSAVLVNTAPLLPTFRIEAIGPDGLLERMLEHPAFLGRVQHRIDAYGLEFATAAEASLELPAFVGNTRMRWGVPVEEPT
jgi:uncharacterized protein YlxW (UPF0749 family)